MHANNSSVSQSTEAPSGPSLSTQGRTRRGLSRLRPLARLVVHLRRQLDGQPVTGTVEVGHPNTPCAVTAREEAHAIPIHLPADAAIPNEPRCPLCWAKLTVEGVYVESLGRYIRPEEVRP